jgi:hypothetical protein
MMIQFLPTSCFDFFSSSDFIIPLLLQTFRLLVKQRGDRRKRYLVLKKTLHLLFVFEMNIMMVVKGIEDFLESETKEYDAFLSPWEVRAGAL